MKTWVGPATGTLVSENVGRGKAVAGITRLFLGSRIRAVQKSSPGERDTQATTHSAIFILGHKRNKETKQAAASSLPVLFYPPLRYRSRPGLCVTCRYAFFEHSRSRIEIKGARNARVLRHFFERRVNLSKLQTLSTWAEVRTGVEIREQEFPFLLLALPSVGTHIFGLPQHFPLHGLQDLGLGCARFQA